MKTSLNFATESETHETKREKKTIQNEDQEEVEI